MKWFPLWTDLLLYVLIGMLLVLIYKVMRTPILRHQMKGMMARPLNLVAMSILLIYTIIGIADSIHFELTSAARQEQYPIQVISLLDMGLKSIINHTEKSYSAPFALVGFSKETFIDETTGHLIRDFPRLEYGGRHISDPEQKSADIKSRFRLIFLHTLLISFALYCLIATLASFKYKVTVEALFVNIIFGRLSFPFRTLFTLIFIFTALILFVYYFSSVYHILGTSKVGEDVFYQSVKSIRTGLVIGTLTTLVMLPFATLLGVMAGYFLGWVDDIIQYLYTTLSSIPGVLLIAAAVLTLQVVMNRHSDMFQTIIERSDARLLALCIILGITSWTGLCRLLRGETLKLREVEFISAARALGVPNFKIIIKHIIPNVMHIILIAIALDFSGLVLAEAVLSYVGVGVDPTTYSWGTMINSARLEMARFPMVWWSLFSAFAFMFFLVLSANVFSDALRDALDPRTQHVGAV